ncbi:hypothetical protein ACFY2W_14825 [Streptomyces sp. NPDC001262]|uniref:hypothetical protein n=1 Tax=unclassified Streptomyces TaxID=2593676 RepID=UPI0036B1058D
MPLSFLRQVGRLDRHHFITSPTQQTCRSDGGSSLWEAPYPTACDRQLVEQAVWGVETAYGIRNPTAPDADIPKGTVDPKSAGILFVHPVL